MDARGQDRPSTPGADPCGVPYVYPAGGAGGFPDPTHPGGDPAAAGLRSEAKEEGVVAAALSALVFLAGVWLVLAPFALDYRTGQDGFDAQWNDLVIGIAIAVVALVRMVAPIRTATVGLINVGLGVWLLAAPFVLFYNADRVATAATVNDMAVGLLVIALAVGSMSQGKRSRRRRAQV